MLQPIVMTVCGDPGGAEAIAPVIKLIEQDKRTTVINYAYNQGVGILKNHGIVSHPLSNANNIQAASAHLQQCKISLLLTGTSYNHLNWEKFFINEARQWGAPSLSVLDFWSNYAVRFSDEKGNLVYMPDQIAVMDDRAQKEMFAAGFPVERMMVTGQPAFDALAHCRQQFSMTKKKKIRASVRIKDTDFLVMFVSQPLSKMYGMKDTAHLGYDEKSVLKSVIHSLEIISKKNNKPVTLLIRPHPREMASDFSEYHSKKITIIVSANESGRDCVMASDLIIGMTSVLLVEACYLGSAVISLQPELRQSDPLPKNAYGISICIYKEDEITPTLEKFLLDDLARAALQARSATPTAGPYASQRITNYIYSKIFMGN